MPINGGECARGHHGRPRYSGVQLHCCRPSPHRH
jgi:hypothetical protein